MSWFTKQIEHPALNALALLATHPDVVNNPALAAAVSSAQADATAVASLTVGNAAVVASQVQASVDPILKDLNDGLIAAMDTALTAYLGPVGTALSPAANTGLVLLEEKAHTLLSNLFHHVKTQ